MYVSNISTFHVTRSTKHTNCSNYLELHILPIMAAMATFPLKSQYTIGQTHVIINLQKIEPTGFSRKHIIPSYCGKLLKNNDSTYHKNVPQRYLVIGSKRSNLHMIEECCSLVHDKLRRPGKILHQNRDNGCSTSPVTKL